jgi:hypothetical protein
MKKVLFSLFVLNFSISAVAQKTLYFDKKLKTVDSPLKARYRAKINNPNEPAKVLSELDNTIYAEGIIYPSDYLNFDGKAVFYDEKRRVKAIRFYQKGNLMPFITIDAHLKKSTQPTLYYLMANDAGEFCAYRRSQVEDVMIASGKIVDTTSLSLDDLVTFYNEKGDVQDVKIFNKGVEKPFFSTTSDFHQLYDILGIVTHFVPFLYDIDQEMNRFLLKCKLTGGDGVVGVKSTPYYDAVQHNTGLLIQGTAIKVKKN